MPQQPKKSLYSAYRWLSCSFWFFIKLIEYLNFSQFSQF
ncbi:hypothetical protein D1AOALGA4SA_8422 [Olavius algarvensis Delta 1 endosymbiont]|nr:hypothetical protein D1AOALGA4SA_8422 [Olavius algarvensis Delta 1 endosymbiont]